MCDPVSTTAGLIKGTKSLVKGMTPDMPTPAAPTPPPQAAKAPDLNIFQNRRKILQGGMLLPTNSPLLTGTGGVPTSALNLGGTRLLGGS